VLALDTITLGFKVETYTHILWPHRQVYIIGITCHIFYYKKILNILQWWSWHTIRVVIEPNRALRFQDWLVYESSLNSWVRTRVKLWNVCSSSAHLKLEAAQAQGCWECHLSRSRLLDKLGSTRALVRLLNFSMCNQSRVQVQVCEQPLYIY